MQEQQRTQQIFQTPTLQNIGSLIGIIEKTKESALTNQEKYELQNKCEKVLETTAMTDFGHRNRITDREAKKQLDALYAATDKFLKRINDLHPSLWPSIMHRWPEKSSDNQINRKDIAAIWLNTNAEDVLNQLGVVQQLKQAVDETRKKS